MTADVPSIVDLINRAFAVEKFFKTGERIDAAGLAEMMQYGEFLLLESGGASDRLRVREDHRRARVCRNAGGRSVAAEIRNR